MNTYHICIIHMVGGTWIVQTVENPRLWYKNVTCERAHPVSPSNIVRNNTPTTMTMVLLSLPFSPS
jgi:hypothetical protein